MILKILTFLVAICFFEIKELFSQSLVGKYSYSTDHFFYKSIELFSNGTFIYKFNCEFLRIKCIGNWQIHGHDLILDSYPQRDRIICHEYRKGRKAYTYFNVKSKDDRGSMFYYLYVIKNSGDTIELKDQIRTSKIRSKGIKGFFIINTSGIKSPTYLIQFKATNSFDILFETNRVFESENWVITETGILPRDNAGEYENFLLRKESHELIQLNLIPFGVAYPYSMDYTGRNAPIMHIQNHDQLIKSYPQFKDFYLNNYQPIWNKKIEPSIFSKVK